MEKETKNKKLAKILRRMVISAMFLALAVVINLFTETGIPLFGAEGIQLKFGGVFTSFPAFLFGPVYGGVVCAASDIIGCIIKPMGPYVPWFTITAFIAGFIKGGVFMLLKKKSDMGIRIFLAVLVAATASIGIFSFVSVQNDGIFDGTYSSKDNIVMQVDEIVKQNDGFSVASQLAISYAKSNSESDIEKITEKDGYTFVRMYYTDENGAEIEFNESTDTSSPLTVTSEFTNNETQKPFRPKYRVFDHDGEQKFYHINNFKKGYSLTLNLISVSFLLFAVLGAVMLVFLFIADKKFPSGAFSSKIFLSIILAEVVQTSINTFVLMKIYAGTYQNFSYALLNLPRVAEGIVMSIILSYFTYVLYQVYDSKIKNKFKW